MLIYIAIITTLGVIGLGTMISQLTETLINYIELEEMKQAEREGFAAIEEFDKKLREKLEKEDFN